MSKQAECVQVVVRCRPFSSKEKAEGCTNIVQIIPEQLQIAIVDKDRPEHDAKCFTFDAVYDETTTQRRFYDESCYDLVEGVMEGYNGTIFAYGQTGCGKSHTMQGLAEPRELRGVIPNSFDHIFENIQAAAGGGTVFLVRCSYLEIYNEEIRDLLSDDPKKKLELREDANKGVYTKDLINQVVSDQAAINAVMDKGQGNRTVGATMMNQTSSRSHSIFTIVIEMNDVDDNGKDHIRVGKLNLVDLAGSERQSKTGASGDRLKEGCKINLSLSALGNVISALVDQAKGKHIPYRDSKLTRLLQDSLGGNTKTLMVAAVSPADYNYEETLSTLRYANRAKNIKNKPKINEDPKDAMLRQYKEEIEALKKALQEQMARAPQQQLPPAATADRERIVVEERVVVEEKVVTVEKLVTVEKEVIPAHLQQRADQAAALETYSRAVEAQRNRMGEELEATHDAVARERQAREALAAKLAALQSRLIGAAAATNKRRRRRQPDAGGVLSSVCAAAEALRSFVECRRGAHKFALSGLR
ncbi:kinesin family member 17 [Tribonema minus]|uniref:Kinesin-like protein n=1 Tax=Tribonema minus TaxID=303371 RepID=A0A835Z9U0_9STRA|nr:kinesin family member 17 [Tribonema minus]